MDTTTLIAIGLALALGFGLGIVLARAKAEARVVQATTERDAAQARIAELTADRETMSNQFKALSADALREQERRGEQAADQRLAQAEALMSPVKDSLAALNERLGQVERDRAAMTAQLREQVSAVQFTGEQLRRETNALSTALRKPQVRGAWGELQLRRVVELAGMVDHCDFYEQASGQTSGETRIRPDMKVMLGEGKFVYVDAKVPLSAFLDAQETDDPEAQQEFLSRFADNVKSHVDALSGKRYWTSDAGSPEFVVLFIPSEALAAEALSQRPDLHEYASGKSIIIATPTTLIGLLRAVAYGWKQAALAESAAEVSMLGRELHDRLASMGAHFAKVGRSLQQSVTAYNAAVGSLEGRVLVTARKLRDLQVTEAELPPPQGVDTLPRQLSAPELLANAAEEWELLPGEPDVAELVAETTPEAEVLGELG